MNGSTTAAGGSSVSGSDAEDMSASPRGAGAATLAPAHATPPPPPPVQPPSAATRQVAQTQRSSDGGRRPSSADGAAAGPDDSGGSSGQGAPAQGQALSVLRVKVSKLERLYKLTKKKLEDTTRRANGLAAQLAATTTTTAGAGGDAAAASCAGTDAASAALRAIVKDAERGRVPCVLQRLELDLGKAVRPAASTGGAGGAGSGAGESHGDDGDLRRLTVQDYDNDAGSATGSGADAGSDRVVQRWCLLARAVEGDGDGGDGSGATVSVDGREVEASSAVWVREDSMAEVLPPSQVPRQADLGLVTALGAKDAAKLRAKCQRMERQLVVMQDRHREHRIRSEALLRQTEAQVTEAKNQALELMQKRISGADLETQLNAARRQVESLTRSYEELQAVDTARRRNVRSLNKDLRSAMQEAAAWRRRYEEAVREVQAQASKAADAPAGVGAQATAGAGTGAGSGAGDGSGGGGGDSAAGAGGWGVGGDDDSAKHLAELTAEYAVYRKRALEIISKKDTELQQLHAMLRRQSDAGHGSGPGPGSGTHRDFVRRGSSEFGAASESEGGSSKVMRGVRDEATREYLKNVLMRYMLSSDPEVRGQLETAIAAVMGFSAVEMARVKQARTEAANSGSLWFKATSLFGGT